MHFKIKKQIELNFFMKQYYKLSQKKEKVKCCLVVESVRLAVVRIGFNSLAEFGPKDFPA